MPLIETKGAASAQGFGLTLGGAEPVYIEQIFSTYLYTGNGSTQTITNGIDLSGKGGLVWIKSRNLATYNHALFDTNRGVNRFLITDGSNAELTASSNTLTAFNSNGFSLGADTTYGLVNQSNSNLVSWTFRKQPKFFDVVTWTGDGTANRAIPHNLGSVPGMVFMKKTSGTGEWYAWSRAYSFAGGTAPSVNCMGTLNSTIAFNGGYSETQRFSPYPTATEFYTGSVTTSTGVNNLGDTYVAYLFAHNAGGFGLTGTDNVISCGSFTADGSGNATINLGYEPQWVMVKRTDSTSNWFMVDSMRGNPTLITSVSNEQILRANTSDAETSSWGFANPTATGFQAASIGASSTWIYIAIRRGPMKTPTTGTSVLNPTQTSATSGTVITTGFPVDFQMIGINDGSASNMRARSRLTGINSTTGSVLTPYLVTSSTAAETSAASGSLLWDNTGFQVPTLNSGNPTIFWSFGRAPGFFDEVCYTGDYAGNPQIPHNLTVSPELIIAKCRSGTGAWYINSPLIGTDYQLAFNTSAKSAGSTYTLTPTYFQNPDINYPTGGTFVAYLFASCPGVSKCFSFTGTGTLQTINCGFASGARLVLIKRTDAAGDWYIWDSSRGISSANDPYLLLNSTAAEVTTTNWVDATSVGFQVTAASGNNVNINGASYIGLAIS